MKLLLLNQFYAPDISPTAQLAASLAQHRAELGDEVTVVASSSHYATHENDSVHSDGRVRVHRIWTPNLGKKTVLRRCADYSAFYLGALTRVATLPAQDVIVSLTTPPYIAWAGVAHAWLNSDASVVLWNMDCYPEAAERLGKLRPSGPVAKAMRRLNRLLFRRLDHVVCLDSAMQTLLMSQYAPAGGRLPSSVIPNWESLGFYPRDRQPPAWSGVERYGLTGRFVILYLGNMGEGHDFETALGAAEQLQHEPVTFLFIGGGKRQAEVKALANTRRLGNVIVADYIPRAELTGAMACADCTLISLRDDCLGVMSPSKLHANLAMGLPVLFVGPEGCNVDEAIRTFDCGVSLRAGDTAGVVAFLREGLLGAQRFKEYGGRARAAFESTYCDAQALARFDALLEQLITGAEPTQAI